MKLVKLSDLRIATLADSIRISKIYNKVIVTINGYTTVKENTKAVAASMRLIRQYLVSKYGEDNVGAVSPAVYTASGDYWTIDITVNLDNKKERKSKQKESVDLFEVKRTPMPNKKGKVGRPKKKQ